ncbi:transporter substrate-binding domain-containing protein [Desulfococcus sp.]|uniref:transporter substrate-binding domain-containing protein n=1 Tax=Desulfococcus sp. TaxID=2025834 RepID=UPI0035940ED3
MLKRKTGGPLLWLPMVALVLSVCWGIPPRASAGDLETIRAKGVLRHLAIPYANFVRETGRGPDGLDVELMQAFSAHLGVAYELVRTDWKNIIPDLTGKIVTPRGEAVVIEGDAPVRGDVIATGFTVLPWRKKIMDFSEATFPSGVWLVAESEAPISPISPTGDILNDIREVKGRMKGISVLTLKNSCLDAELYGIAETGAGVRMFPEDRDLEEMIPSVVAQMADATLIDAPVALAGLSTWPGKIKIIGPVSEAQEMAAAFPKGSPRLRRAFDEFFTEFKKSGRYRALVDRYYPSAVIFYPDFFK